MPSRYRGHNPFLGSTLDMVDVMRFRSFVAVAEELNVGRAARRLRVAQPALTRRIHALEREIGARLLERHARGVRLTPAGAAFLEHARAVVAAADAAVVSARETALRTRLDVLRVTPPDWPNRARPVQRAIDAFRQAQPGVEVEYDMTPWALAPRALVNGLTDISFTIAMHPNDYGPAVVSHRMLDEPGASAVLPKTHPLADRATVTLRDLRGTPLLVPSRDDAEVLHDQMVAVVRSGGYEPRVVAAPASFALAAQMVVAGAGWTITTHSVGEEPPHGVAVIPIEDAQFMLGFYLIHRVSDDRESVREFIRHFRCAMEQVPVWSGR